MAGATVIGGINVIAGLARSNGAFMTTRANIKTVSIRAILVWYGCRGINDGRIQRNLQGRQFRARLVAICVKIYCVCVCQRRKLINMTDILACNFVSGQVQVLQTRQACKGSNDGN